MSKTKQLIVLAEKLAEKLEVIDDAGKEKFSLPASHKPVIVLQGNQTFSCASCKFVNAEKHECNNKYYIEYVGSKKLPDAPLHLICSDFFEPK